jgi:hypothetical protein
MGNPGAIVAQTGFAFFIGAHAGQGGIVGGGVVLDGNLGGHAPHGVGPPFVARRNDQADIGLHQRGLHADAGPIGQDIIGVGPQVFDITEHIIPTATVQGHDVFFEFIQDFLGLKGSGEGFNQDRHAQGALRKAQQDLDAFQNAAPKAGFQPVFQLGQIKIGSAAAGQQRCRVMKRK